jgi:hypothetical protein
MVRFVLHIGDQKCGSSAIQSALWLAQDRLCSHGLLYHSTQIRSGHSGFVTLLGVQTRGDDAKSMVTSEAAIKHMRLRLAAGGISHVILSAESFIALSPDSVLRIVGMISSEIAGVDVVAYVREPASMYLSWIQQRLKGDHLIFRPERYCHGLDRLLIPWKDVCGVDSVAVRAFEPALLSGGSVVSDFSAVLAELTGVQIDLKDTRENVSLTAEQMVILQTFRGRFFADVRGKQNRDTNLLIDMFAGLNAIGLVGSPPRLQPRWADLIRVNSVPVFARLNDRFSGIGALLPEVIGREISGIGTPSRARDVRTVLEPIDRDASRLLKFLIPEFQSDLPERLSPRVLNAVRAIVGRYRLDLGRVIPVLCRYWRQKGCSSAAQELEASLLEEGGCVPRRGAGSD